MSDQESSNFKVVDRRHAAAESTADHQSASAEAQTAATEVHADISGSASEAGMEPEDNTASHPEQDSPGSDAGAFPDPSVLLSIAAMQMDVRTLALALLAVFDGQAWRAMGFLADPKTGETTKDLPSAQLAIDCVQFLLSKVEGGLPDSERREMQRRLTDLRMNYLSKLREG